MDPLVLESAIDELAADWRGARLDALRQESPHRYRLHFERPHGSLVVSLAPGRPWIGRPVGRWPGPRWSQPPLHRQAEAFARSPIVEIERRALDRWLALRLADGARIVVELPDHGANLILVDADGAIVGAARERSRRIRVGERYEARPLPPAMLDPRAVPLERLERIYREHRDDERPPPELRAIGRAAWELTRARGAEALVDGLARLEPERRDGRLWPWPSGEPRGDGALREIGAHHEALDREALDEERRRALRRLASEEERRALAAAGRAAGDARGFADPERHGRLAEALLAGIGRARRVDADWLVPDPYGGAELRVPGIEGLEPAALATRYYERQRRALRGRERAREREASMRARAERLARLIDVEDLDELERALRREGIAVGLNAPGKRAREASRAAPVRPAGVRIFTSRDGHEILVGKGARENDRLTFKLAGPEDHWFHAREVPGAHVIVRAPAGKGALPRGTVEEAAALAAWFSEARGAAAVDVLWTRRKYVRRARKGGPGQVVLKRSETVRVKPRRPPSQG